MVYALIAYADEQALTDAADAIDAAKGAPALTDASGRPVDPATHPLLARNPGFKVQYAAPLRLPGKGGGFLYVDGADSQVQAALKSDISKAVVLPARTTPDASALVAAVTAALADKASAAAAIDTAIDTAINIKAGK